MLQATHPERFAGPAVGEGVVAAADIGGTRLRMMLAGRNGHAAAEWATHIPDGRKHPQDVLALIEEGLSTMRQSLPHAAPLLHMTVGAPGITDADGGVVLAAPNLPGWTNVPLRSLLERRFAVRAAVDNDTNLAAVGEHAAGAARGVDDFVFLALGTGVGAGIFLRGALHRGARWSAGEIGYLPVHGLPRSPVRLSETGQMEGEIGGAGIEAQWARVLEASGGGSAKEKSLRAPQIFDLAEAGDRRAMRVLQSSARILADAVVTLGLFFDPSRIVLGGGVGAHQALRFATEGYLRENEFAVPELCCSTLGTQAQLFGAVAVSLAALPR